MGFHTGFNFNSPVRSVFVARCFCVFCRGDVFPPKGLSVGFQVLSNGLGNGVYCLSDNKPPWRRQANRPAKLLRNGAGSEVMSEDPGPRITLFLPLTPVPQRVYGQSRPLE